MYVCPNTKQKLVRQENGLLSQNGIYPFINTMHDMRVPNFLSLQAPLEASSANHNMYGQVSSPEVYKNFLHWLFETFNESEFSFRRSLISKLRLQQGSKVLVTGCGDGNDIEPILDIVGRDGAVYANDLSPIMVAAALDNYILKNIENENVFFSVCDAQILPFTDNSFDGAFHFGGINSFDNVKQAIEEMDRVVKPGGRVVFGDEGIAPWLLNTEYGRIAVKNNPLWSAKAPIELLPRNCLDVHLSWVLGNCFYVIDFEVSSNGPFMNIDIRHKGWRGGSMRTRYFGQLEGVTEESKKFVLEDARRKGISVHDWLEQAIREKGGIN